MLVVIASPGLDACLGIGQVGELMHIQTLIPQLGVERFDVAVARRFARPGEIVSFPVKDTV